MYMGINAVFATCTAGVIASFVGGYSAQQIADKLLSYMVDEEALKKHVQHLQSPEYQYEQALKEVGATKDTHINEIRRQRKLDLLKYHPDKLVDATEEQKTESGQILIKKMYAFGIIETFRAKK